MIQSVSGSLAQAVYGASNSRAHSTAQAGRRDEGQSRATNPEARASSAQTGELTVDEQRQVRELQAADRNVRAHEQAHMAVGGDLVRGGVTFSYATGPDGKRYAVAGEVSIDTSPARTPEATIPKAQHIREAALAPTDPSPQDRSVAAGAAQMEDNARRELAAIRQGEAKDSISAGRAGIYRGVQANSQLNPGSNLDVYA